MICNFFFDNMLVFVVLLELFVFLRCFFYVIFICNCFHFVLWFSCAG
jgi:hypothetical protein